MTPGRDRSLAPDFYAHPNNNLSIYLANRAPRRRTNAYRPLVGRPSVPVRSARRGHDGTIPTSLPSDARSPFVLSAFGKASARSATRRHVLYGRGEVLQLTADSKDPAARHAIAVGTQFGHTVRAAPGPSFVGEAIRFPPLPKGGGGRTLTRPDCMRRERKPLRTRTPTAERR